MKQTFVYTLRVCFAYRFRVCFAYRILVPFFPPTPPFLPSTFAKRLPGATGEGCSYPPSRFWFR